MKEISDSVFIDIVLQHKYFLSQTCQVGIEVGMMLFSELHCCETFAQLTCFKYMR